MSHQGSGGAGKPQACFLLPSSLCSLDLLLGFNCESLDLSKCMFLVSGEHADLRPHKAELFRNKSDTATAQL